MLELEKQLVLLYSLPVTHIYFLHSILPHPPKFSFSHSFLHVAVSTCTSVYKYTYFLDSENERAHAGFFLRMCPP